ncbi:GNAT family N-acetyltransferase [bacterium]|nr:GNAT family N-acetyltransferase [bacterium]
MHEFNIYIKDINKLSPIDVVAIKTRLSWPDSGSTSSIQKELDKRYFNAERGPHPEMALAIIWFDGTLVGWVGTRPWPEKFKGDLITAQTVECFVDPDYRRRGLGRLGLQALICAGFMDKTKPVSVYEPEVVKLAEQCGCKIVLLCEAT